MPGGSGAGAGGGVGGATGVIGGTTGVEEGATATVEDVGPVVVAEGVWAKAIGTTTVRHRASESSLQHGLSCTLALCSIRYTLI